MCLAIPGRIISIEDDGAFRRTGKVSFGGLMRCTDLTFVPEARIGDYVIVHAGFAISTIDEQEATAVFDTIKEMIPPNSDEPVER
jgi:hydrogenase expression/formation protein HypC